MKLNNTLKLLIKKIQEKIEEKTLDPYTILQKILQIQNNPKGYLSTHMQDYSSATCQQEGVFLTSQLEKYVRLLKTSPFSNIDVKYVQQKIITYCIEEEIKRPEIHSTIESPSIYCLQTPQNSSSNDIQHA
jgi:hypothetical protein